LELDEDPTIITTEDVDESAAEDILLDSDELLKTAAKLELDSTEVTDELSLLITGDPAVDIDEDDETLEFDELELPAPPEDPPQEFKTTTEDMASIATFFIFLST